MHSTKRTPFTILERGFFSAGTLVVPENKTVNACLYDTHDSGWRAIFSAKVVETAFVQLLSAFSRSCISRLLKVKIESVITSI